MSQITTSFDKMSEARASIARVSQMLGSLAGGFSRTGNSHVANELFDHVEALILAAGQINDASGEIVSSMVRGSEQASANMLAAAIAGVTIAKSGRESADIDG